MGSGQVETAPLETLTGLADGDAPRARRLIAYNCAIWSADSTVLKRLRSSNEASATTPRVESDGQARDFSSKQEVLPFKAYVPMSWPST